MFDFSAQMGEVKTGRNSSRQIQSNTMEQEILSNHQTIGLSDGGLPGRWAMLRTGKMSYYAAAQPSFPQLYAAAQAGWCSLREP